MVTPSMKLCTRCNRMKPDKEFYPSNPNWCIDCAVHQNKINRDKRRNKAIEILGGKCSKCQTDMNLNIMDRENIPKKLNYFTKISQIIKYPEDAPKYHILRCDDCMWYHK